MTAMFYPNRILKGSDDISLWQRNRFGPLGVVVLLHAGLFFALRSGIPHAAVPADPKEMFASLIAPEQPSAVSAPQPQQPVPIKPQPNPRPAPPKPVRKTPPAPAAIAAPSPHAISAAQSAPEPSPMQDASASAATTTQATVASAAAPTAPAQPKTISSGVEYLQTPQPRYPPLSRRTGEEGRTILRVLVNAQGMPERADIRTSSGSARLDDAAREAVMRAQFRPHIDNGVAVAVFVIVPILFQLHN